MYYLLHWLFIGLLFFSRCNTILSEPQKISFLFINDKFNEIATRSLDTAIKYFQANPDLNVEIEKDIRLVLVKDDPKELLENVCAKYDEAALGGDTPVILDATRSGMFSESVKAFTNSLKLPTVSTSYGTSEDLRHWNEAITKNRGTYLVQIRPPGDLIPQMIQSIVKAQDIKNAGILFDESYVMDYKYSSLLRNIPTRHMIRSISSSGSDIAARLEDFIEHRIFNYFILGSMQTISNTLDIAEQKNYFKTEYAWNFFTEDTEDFAKKPCPGKCKFVFLKPASDPDLINRITPLKIEDKPYLVSVFFFEVYYKTFIAVKTLKETGNWPKEFLYKQCSEYKGDGNDGDIQVDLRAALKAVPKVWYSPFTFGKDTAQMNFKMNLELIEYDDNGPKMTPLITWLAGAPEVKFENTTFVKKQSAIVKYTIVTRLQKPFMMKETDENGNVQYVGYCRDLLEEIRVQMDNFEFTIYEVKDNQFGSLNKDNTTWNGLIGELIDKKADIALSSLSVMAERENVIDFTVPYYDLVGYTILMKKPTQPTSLFKFLTVLEKTVWLCILAAYFFTSFLMWVFDRWSPYSFQNNREKYKDDEEKREFTLKECLWFCMTSLTPQGGGEAPKNLSGRLVAATWWLFGFIIIASYTANLAAFLTVSRLDTPVESLEDLSKQYKILYAPIRNSDAMVYFQRMANIEHRFYEIWKDMSLNDSLSEIERAKLAVWDYPVSDKYTKIWQAMNEADFPQDLNSAVKRVQESNDTHGFAFIGDATDIRYLALTNCDLQMVGDEFSRKPYALATQQGSPLKDSLNNAILQLLNKRKLEKLKETWWKETVECDKTDEQTDGISIQNIGGVFIVIFVGIGMACMTLVFEYWWYKHRKNPNLIEVGPTNPPNQFQGPEKTKADFFGGFRNRNTKTNQHRLGNAGITNQW